MPTPLALDLSNICTQAATPAQRSIPSPPPPAAITRDQAEEVMTVDEVAALLRVDRKTVYESIRKARLPAVRLGRAIRISRAEVQRWLAATASTKT